MKKITYETLFLFRQLQNGFFLIFILKIAKETGGSIPVAPIVVDPRGYSYSSQHCCGIEIFM